MTRWSQWTMGPVGYDAFGFYYSGKIFRNYFEGKGPLHFYIEHEQVENLRDTVKSISSNFEDWYQVLGPLAFSTMEKSGKVALQYPPGTGLIFSLLPEKSAPNILSQIDVLVIFFGMLFLFLLSQRARPPNSFWLVYFSTFASILTIDIVTGRSFSIQSSFLFLILGQGVLVYLSSLDKDVNKGLNEAPKNHRAQILLSILGGTLLGFACLCRLPIVFHFLGWVALIAYDKKKIFFFAFGFALSFVLPMALYNWSLTGVPWQSSYPHYDTQPPTLDAMWETVPFFFWGKGSRLNAFLLVVLMGAWWTRHSWSPAKKQWLQLMLLALPPTLYLITHKMFAMYYMFPTILVVMWSVSLMSYFTGTIDVHEARLMSGKEVQNKNFVCDRIGQWIVGGALLASTSFFVYFHREPYVFETKPTAKVSAVVRKIMENPKAYIYSEFLSGTVLYEYGKPGFKLSRTTPEIRKEVNRRIHLQGYEQYWLKDEEVWGLIDQELSDIDAKLVKVGSIYGKELCKIVFIDSK